MKKNLRATALAAAKANQEVKALKISQRAAHETIRDIVHAVRLLRYDFLEANHPLAQNLTPEQNILLDAIRNHAKAFVKSYGYDTLAEEMNKAKLDGGVAKIFYQLRDEAEAKNKKSAPSISEQIESAKQRAQAQNEQRANAPVANHARKRGGDER